MSTASLTKKSTATKVVAASKTPVAPKRSSKKGTGDSVKPAVTPAVTPGPAPVKSPAASTAVSSSAAALPTMTSAQIASCLALITAFLGAIPALPALSAAQKKRTVKLRKGGSAFVPNILALAATYGVQSSELPLSDVQSQLATASALADVETQLVAAQKALGDYLFSLQSSSWSTASAAYVVLSRLSKKNPAITAGLAPVKAFFTYRTPAVKANHPKTAKGKAALATAKANAGSSSPSPTPATPQVASVAASNATNGAAAASASGHA